MPGLVPGISILKPVMGKQATGQRGLAVPIGASDGPTMARRNTERRGSVPSNRVASFLLFAVVALAPAPFGSTDPPTIALWCIVLGIALVVASPRALRASHLIVIAGAAVVVLAYAFVLHEQLSAHPWFAAPNPLWRAAAEALRTEFEPSVSIARNQPFFALGAPLAAVLALLCALIICADQVRARQLLAVVGWSGVAYAAFGIITFLLDPARLLWREKLAYTNVLTSTFVNRNTAAVYFGSCAVVWIVLLSEQLRRRLPRGEIRWRAMAARLAYEQPLAVFMALSMLLVCLAAMFMTGSRAGVVLSLAALVIAFTAFFRRDLPSRSGVMVTVVCGGALALAVLQVMGAGVSSRFDVEGLASAGRMETYRSTLRLIAEHPWFGTGLGTFAWSFPAYRSGSLSVWGIWDRAHSTPLELAADLGLPLAGLIAVAWLAILAVVVRGVRLRRRGLAYPVVALSVAVLALCHSAVDFSLQIPGYAIVVFALVGAGISQSFTGNSAKSVEG